MKVCRVSETADGRIIEVVSRVVRENSAIADFQCLAARGRSSFRESIVDAICAHVHITVDPEPVDTFIGGLPGPSVRGTLQSVKNRHSSSPKHSQ